VNRIDLAGRVAIVTGAAGGIGRAIVARLRESGALVAALDLPGAARGEAEFAADCDVADPAQVEAAFARAARELGPPDILVNAAGVAGEMTAIADASLESWRRTLEVNLTGTFLCCRAAIPGMVARGYGRIVNLGSSRGREGTPGSGAYAPAKAAVATLTRMLGAELATTGVIVNCVAPTAIEGGMSDGLDAAARAATLARIPMGRLGTAAEVAATVAWLASAECSFSTGASFDLSGGRLAY
jgi:3-oxoacyl-[acyl-carrier protein] reductase